MTKELILEIVSNASGQPKEKIIGLERYKQYLEARHILIFFLRKKLKMTYMEIGKFLGRDHTTIIHSVNKVQDLIDVQDSETIQLYDMVDLAYQHATKEPYKLLVEISKDENINDVMYKIINQFTCKVTKL